MSTYTIRVPLCRHARADLAESNLDLLQALLEGWANGEQNAHQIHDAIYHFQCFTVGA